MGHPEDMVPMNTYDGSGLQTTMTLTYTGVSSNIPTIKAMAVVPLLGNHTSTNAYSLPTPTLASTAGQTKDIFFAPSYAEIYRFNNNSTSSFRAELKAYPGQFWTRTADSVKATTRAWVIKPGTPDSFQLILSVGFAYYVPAVWVKVGTVGPPPVNVTVTEKYVDINGVSIQADTSTTVTEGGLYNKSIPILAGYDVKGYKVGAPPAGYGTFNTNNPAQIPNVSGSPTIYFVYQTHNNPDPEPSSILAKNASIKGTADNGTSLNPVPVEKNEEIVYKITVENKKDKVEIPGQTRKYDILFLLDWSGSMGPELSGTMAESKSGRDYQRQLMQNMSEYIFEKYPGSRVALLGMNTRTNDNTNATVNCADKPEWSYIQLQTDFMNKTQYYAALSTIQSAFADPIVYYGDDNSQFLAAAVNKMQGKNTTYGSSLTSPGSPKTIIPRNEIGERIPVIIHMSDFQMREEWISGDNYNNTWPHQRPYWSDCMKNQATAYNIAFPDGILWTVRFDHAGNQSNGFNSTAYDNLMKTNVAPAGRSHWGFTKINQTTPYTTALEEMKSELLTLVPPAIIVEGEQGTIVTDEVPVGLDVDEISHGGTFTSQTREIKWDLSGEPSGKIIVSFKATVKTPGKYDNFARATYYDKAYDDSEYTHHKCAEAFTDVTISKQVEGGLADKNKPFEFIVYIQQGKAGSTISYEGPDVSSGGILTFDANGKTTFNFTLKHGQSITLKDMPSTAEIKIVETPNSNYQQSYTDSGDSSDTGKTEMKFKTVGNNARTFEFLNKHIEIIPTGIFGNTQGIWMLFLAVLIISASFVVIELVRKKYKIGFNPK
jgi:hypothetical protein